MGNDRNDVRSAVYGQPVGNLYVDDEEDGEEEDYEVEPGTGVQRRVVKDVDSDGDGDDESDGEGPDNGIRDMGSDDDDDSDEEDGEGEVVRDEKRNGGYSDVRFEDADVARHQMKKRKMKSLISSYELVPRVPAPTPPRPAPAPPAPKPYSGGRNSLTDWTERETHVLLDAWGERFLRRGRKSLRLDEWREVTEKVLEVSRIQRTDTQCRNRLDTLKKKYKKEKAMVSSKWVYFKKMHMLISSSSSSPPSPPRKTGLSCGLDSGGYVFENPRTYLNRPNGSNEMRDSPGDDSESTEGNNDSDGLPPKKRRSGRDNDSDEVSSVRLLADCIHKFSNIYEKTENSNRKQMAELEKMRMDFHRDLEMQKREFIEAEIARMQEESENA